MIQRSSSDHPLPRWLYVACGVLAWVGASGAQTLTVSDAFSDPNAATMQSYSAPWGAAQIQLVATYEQDGSTTDVTDQVVWSSSDPVVGVVNNAGYFLGLTRGRTLVTATLGTLTSPPVMIDTRISSEEHPAGIGTRGAGGAPSTNDTGITMGIEQLFDLFDMAGIDTTDFRAVHPNAHYHEEGVNSDGVVIRSKAQAATLLPAPDGGEARYNYNGRRIRVYDGNSHTVFRSGDAQALRDGMILNDGRKLLTKAAATALHELVHVVIFRCGIDAGEEEEEEELVAALENLLQRLVQAGLDPTKKHKGFIKLFHNMVAAAIGGPALLAKFGVNDSDSDGIPDVIDDDSGTGYVAPSGSDATGDGSLTNPYRTLQYAYSQAGPRGTIRALPGTYNECVLAAGPPGADKGVFFVADAFLASGDNTVTIIDGSGVCDGIGNTPGSAITIGGSSGGIQGFTITGAGNSGIRAEGNVVIDSNVIDTNFGVAGGGLLYTSNNCGYGDTLALISHNTLANNVASPGARTGSVGRGGGAALFAQSTGGFGTCLAGNSIIHMDCNTFDNNRIEEPFVTGVSYFGAGAFVSTVTQIGTAAEVHASHNTFTGNQLLVPNASGGGAWFETVGQGSDTIFVEYSTFSGNLASANGGGLAAEINNFLDGDHYLQIYDVTADANTAADNGGGFFFDVAATDLTSAQEASLRAYKLSATGNSAEGGSLGGGGGLAGVIFGFRSAAAAQLSVIDSRFSGNTAINKGAGAALLVGARGVSGAPSSAALKFSNNMVDDNQLLGGTSGSGVLSYQEAIGPALAMTTFELSTVAGNQDTVAPGVQIESFTEFDTAATQEGQAHFVFTNNIVADNDFGLGGPVPGDPGALTSGGTGNLQLDIFDNDVTNNTGGNYASWIGDRTGSQGNIDGDPLFVDPTSGNYHLSPGSPAIDAAIGTYLCDIDGNFRPFNGLPDMGADEWIGCIDNDADGFGSGMSAPLCSGGNTVDCDDLDDQVWTRAGPVTSVTADHDRGSGVSTFLFSAPQQTGGTAPVTYDAIRSPDASDLAAPSVCLETSDTDTVATDPGTPAAGQAWYYLFLARNNCGPGGSGTGSNRVERIARDCLDGS